MYGQSSTTPAVLGAATTAVVLPATGATGTVEIAIAAAVGLAVWALIYLGYIKFGKR